MVSSGIMSIVEGMVNWRELGDAELERIALDAVAIHNDTVPRNLKLSVGNRHE